VALAALCLATVAAAPIAPIVVNGGWTRPTAAGLNGVGYFTVVNRGPRPDRLTGASSPVASAVSIHRSLEVGGVMTMRALPSLDVGGGTKVTFAPGGLHLMLEGLRRPLRAGESIPVSLTFTRAGRVRAILQVRAGATAMPGMAN
jgi:copper(I)-binding protein